jgi:exodeoxyribonuclease VII small subunit
MAVGTVAALSSPRPRARAGDNRTERAVAKAKQDRRQADDADVPVEFEAAMRELETLVEKLEHGEFTLEESIKQYERGMALTRACEKALRAAEQKVLALAGEGKHEVLEDFTPDDDED